MKYLKSIISISCLATAALLIAACGPGEQDDGVITITGNDQMQFSPTEFRVAAGSEVTLIFRNIGQMPKEAMGHNLAILPQGTDPQAFAQEAIRHEANEYIPPEWDDRVIAATRVLGPGEEETLVFTAPSEPGEYPFVCSFPGHTPAGMWGTMTVE